MLTGWGDAALDAAIVAGAGVAFAYLGADDLIAKGVFMLTKGAIPAQLMAPLATGIVIGTTVFITDLVYMYKFDYH